MAYNKEVAMCRPFFAFLFALVIVPGNAQAKPGIQAVVAASASAPLGACSPIPFLTKNHQK